MNKTHSERNVFGLCAALCAIWATLFQAGCGDGGTTLSMQVRKTPAQRPDLNQAALASGTLGIPGEHAFNLNGFTFGGEGHSEAKSVDEGKSSAGAKAEVRDGGSVWAEFQLGYCFDNTTGVPLDAGVRVRVKAIESHTADRGESEMRDAPIAASTLKFFIKDTNGQIIKEEPLVTTSLGKGPNSLETAHDFVFDARFLPERGYYLVIAGRVEAKALPAKSAEVSLRVSDCAIDITWNPAGSTQAATDVAGETAVVAQEPPDQAE